MIPPLLSASPDARLPHGRHVCSIEEVQREFVQAPRFALSTRREAVWNDFLMLIQLLKRRKVDVPAAFIGGTFVTGKIDPDDVDGSLIIDATSIRDSDTLGIIDRIVSNAKSKGLQVDGFIILWDAQPDESQVSRTYLESRGKWDDWWQRDVEKHERSIPVREHSIPKRGYLEVIIDGYR